MRVALFDFDLPADLIAQQPARPRDSARLLHVDAGMSLHAMRDLPVLLRPGDLLVVNDTRVLPTRFRAGRIEVTLVESVDDRHWLAFAKPGRAVRIGESLVLAPGLDALPLSRQPDGRILLRFDRAGGELIAGIERHGAMPLPPYIKRADGPHDADRADYQTLFAADPGAVAAPTAGLHFTTYLLDALAARGIGRAALTLHVGLGTFAPVRVEDTAEHVMHAERFSLPDATVRAIERARASGGRTVAVGTTVLRALEASVDSAGKLQPGMGETRIFITPGHHFRTADLLLTNFHLPRSTLFMLVSAFGGLERMQGAYAAAIAEGLRFYSYGDACLITRNDG
ncbi:MAG TPA: tRNA preQ1(34) S-adenosylmethionine ribosyltransferase-isomerase QueA [Geminicoccaceae bacterium]|nr:tRNA preQ1(34) S-adenosylmethionine ribosyltransferase-isomerase QueA [Geminicoccus sp.]HMU52441.1 tRNA preQ1(34) S-adenosylmethionine ribosyltransferase-isomerase QueA [Geminicoccaceae bacterium]